MLADFIEAQAASRPDAPALWVDGQWLDYRTLNHRANGLARRLQASGVGPGDRIAILALNHAAHFDLALAALKLGFVHVPLNHRLTPAELAAMSALVRPALLFVDAAHRALAEALALPVQPLETYEDWLAAAADDAPVPARPLHPDALHMILFTGGSTGQPKAACLPYRQTLGNAEDTIRAWGLDDGDAAIQCTPCFHAAVNVLSLPLLMVGGRVLLMPRFEPEAYLVLAQREQVSWLFMVPTMYRALVDAPAFATLALPRLRAAISGGAPCPPALQARLAERGIVLRQGFGMTEAGVNCFRITAEEAAAAPDAVGRPMPGLQMMLRDADGRPVASPDEVGELTLAGPQICAGYFGLPDADHAAQGFRDGWLWTGDLARIGADGLYRICGRRKDIYISGGENIYPAEVEAALAACDGVAECVVFGWPHPHWGECGIALVVPAAGAQLDAATLRLQLRTRLAGYKLPLEIDVVLSLPKSGAGKILRNEARSAYQAPAHLAGTPPSDLSTAA